MTKQTTIVVIGSLRVNSIILLYFQICVPSKELDQPVYLYSLISLDSLLEKTYDP